MNDPQVFYRLYPIGTIRRDKDMNFIEVGEAYRPAMQQLEHFTHILVFWWAHRHDDEESRSQLQTYPPYAPDVLTGVFATRSEYRPNPIAVTVCEVIDIDHDAGRIYVVNIDAYDGTPLIDVKGYFPVCERVKAARIPAWLTDLGMPDWFPDEGMGLWD